MGLKQQVEGICRDAKKQKAKQLIKLPEAPGNWNEEKKTERLYQLHALVKRLGCVLEQVDADHFSIRVK